MVIEIINREKLEVSQIKISGEKCYVKDIFVSQEIELVAGFFDFDKEYSEDFTFADFPYNGEQEIKDGNLLIKNNRVGEVLRHK